MRWAGKRAGSQEKHASLKMLRQLTPNGVRFTFVRQEEPRGLGHAILCARHQIGNEPFAVLLPDDLIDAHPPVLAQMIAQYEQAPSSLVAVRPVPREDTRHYGIVDACEEDGESPTMKIRNLVRSLLPCGPSNLAIVGRYNLSPTIFECLANLEPGIGGEISAYGWNRRLLKLEPVMVPLPRQAIMMR